MTTAAHPTCPHVPPVEGQVGQHELKGLPTFERAQAKGFSSLTDPGVKGGI